MNTVSCKYFSSYFVGSLLILYIVLYGICQDVSAMSCKSQSMRTADLSTQLVLPEGQAWEAEIVLDEAAKKGMDGALLVRFVMDGKEPDRISGYDGCNFFFGSYTITNDILHFSHMGSTRRMCMPDPVLEAQTQAMYDMMSKPVVVVREGNALEWWQDGQRRIVWRMVKDPFFKPKIQEPAK